MDENYQVDQGPASPRLGGRNVFQVIWQRRALILFGLALGVTFGVLTYSQRSPVYRSAAQVLVVKKQAANALPVAGGDPRMAVMEDYVATHLIVIRSPVVIEMAVKKRNLGALKSLQGKSAVGTIQAGLVASRDSSKDSAPGAVNNILNLSYSATDPADVETVLSAIIESYKDFLDKTYQNASEDTVGFIRQAVDTLTKDKKREEKEYQDFRNQSKVQLILGENGVPLHQTQILDYHKRATESLVLATEVQKRIVAVENAIEQKQPTDVILALAQKRFEKGTQNNKTNATALETALFPLMQQETELLQVYGKDHPEVIRIRERIKSAKNFHQRIEEISREGESSQPGSDPVQSALKALQLEHLIHTQNHEHWNDLLEELKAKARSLENHYEQDKAYRNNIARVEHVLDTTTKRLEEINLIRGYGGFEAKTLSPPAPGGKVSPVLWQFLLMGAAVGFGLSAVGAYLLDMADKSFRNPEEVRRRLGLPIVGHVPYVPTSVEPVKMIDGAGNPIELDPGLVSFHQPMSPHAEGFRGIRTALYFNTHDQRHTVIQVTSPNMGDGKTTLITNLAISIAQSGRKVLLVDADLRRPRIHRAFGLSSKIGLAEVIAGTAELDEAIQVTVVPNLSALPCGRRPQNPAELLTSPRFEDVIDDLRSAFDYVLIDTPPLLAVSDPCIVAPRVDGLLLTIRLAKNGRPAAERSKDLLAGLKVNCIGLVVNGVGKHGSMSGYGYEHYRYTDDYTTAYTTNDGEHAEMALESGDTGPTVKSTGRSEAKAGERVPPTLGTVAEPSSNGHAAHPLVGE